MISDRARKVEVSLRNCTADERRQFGVATDKDTDQLILNSVFKIVRRAGVPIKHIMAMICILAWKEAPEGTKCQGPPSGQRLHRPRLANNKGRSANTKQYRQALSATTGLFPQV